MRTLSLLLGVALALTSWSCLAAGGRNTGGGGVNAQQFDSLQKNTDQHPVTKDKTEKAVEQK